MFLSTEPSPPPRFHSFLIGSHYVLVGWPGTHYTIQAGLNSLCLFVSFFVLRRVSYDPVDPKFPYIAKYDLKLLILSPLPLECWHHRPPPLVFEVLGTEHRALQMLGQELYLLSHIPRPWATLLLQLPVLRLQARASTYGRKWNRRTSPIPLALSSSCRQVCLEL